MIDHVGLEVSDLGRSARFYEWIAFGMPTGIWPVGFFCPFQERRKR